MRITGGELGGRRLKVPLRSVRPSKDRLRECLFNILAPVLADARVLDLFAGSGSLGFEALSRGAASVTWVEKDALAWTVLNENVRALLSDHHSVKIMRGDAFQFLCAAPSKPSFSLVFLDPPYEPAAEGQWYEKVLKALSEKHMLEKDGIVVAEHRSGSVIADVAGWSLIRTRKVGESTLSFFAGD